MLAIRCTFPAEKASSELLDCILQNHQRVNLGIQVVCVSLYSSDGERLIMLRV